MRIRNPVTVRTPGPRVYQGVRRVETTRIPSARTPSHVQGGWNGGWGGCRGWGCGGWPWWSGPVPIAAPIGLLAPVDPCMSPIVDGRLVVDGNWAINCFWPAYTEARQRWGSNAGSVATEVLLQLVPDASLYDPASGSEVELRRRIESAVALLLSADGIPTQQPRRPAAPRPRRADRIEVPWIRALVTGWV